MTTIFEQWRVPIGLSMVGCSLFLAYFIPNYVIYLIHFRKKLGQFLATHPEFHLRRPLRFHGFASTGLGKDDESSFSFFPFGLLWVAELSDRDKVVVLEAWKWFSVSNLGKDPSHFILIEQADERAAGRRALDEASRVARKVFERTGVRSLSVRTYLTATNAVDAMFGGRELR